MTDQLALTVPDAAVIRDELTALVCNDLHGPAAGEDEEFDERPTDRYPLGRLAPNGAMIRPEEHERLADAESDNEAGESETEAPNIASMFPSSYGFTAHVAAEVDRLEVDASWARYVRTPSEVEEKQGRLVWRREPLPGTATIPLRSGEVPPTQLTDKQPEIVVRGRIRKHDGGWLVTLFLVNAQRGEMRQNDKWIFQARMSVTAPDRAPVFLRRPVRQTGGDAADQAEQRRLAMSYRFHPEFAVGHGVAVHAEPAADRVRAVEISTSAVPVYEVPATDVPSADTDPDLPELADLGLDMKALSEMDGDALRTALSPLATGYRAWLTRMAATLDDPAAHLTEHQADARRNLRDAERAADRIEAGIRLLADDEDALRAFRFANAAMHLQRVHTMAAARRRKQPQRGLPDVLTEVDVVRNRSWRPFQLAFLLLNLPSLTDPGHPERSGRGSAVADLLWFPTGGGKTEAYLGLTAFTLAIRRLRPDLGGYDAANGVAVLMRYTLRLLTIQQFQRAAALICACETLRRTDEARWGDVPFRLGLWVGGRVTPNDTDKSEAWVKDLRRVSGRPRQSATGSPHQLTSCPWCGTVLEAGRDIEIDTVRRRTLIRCPDFDCAFHAYTGDGDGLPVLVVDEEIYRLGPAFVIATVDKFAQLPWLGQTQTLFGRSRRRCERHGYITDDLAQICCEGSSSHKARGNQPAARHVPAPPVRPPDLIIQDELHLISGPLGSLVGLYETAVDRLCAWELTGGHTVRPKIIASTATVRRAGRQLGALFDRARTEIFPPPGLTADDNYFARQRPTVRPAGHDGVVKPGRRYVGICAHGIRIKSTLIRVYVAVLAAAELLHEKYGRNPVTDPYMTLVGYFNSLRDLGGMRRLVEDDVSTRLARADQRGLARRYEPMLRELTSRLSSSDIPEVLAELELQFGPRSKDARRPIDVLLATNMIAVGVDVSRLGVMVVANQPKSAAEYIQATSRVGREHPGLVFTVYNWARPRDLSHYEKFEHFHATVYRHVEALSVTPFAYRAVDRGLTGVLVSLVRALEPTFNPNLAAGRFGRDSQLADHVVNVIRRRARDVLGNTRDSLDVERELDTRLDFWARERAKPDRRLGYRRPRRSADVAGLLNEPDGGPWTKTTCPTSLRDVEPGVRLLLLDEYDLGGDEAPAYQPAPQPEEDA
jgi:hypothetical protein